MQEEKQTFIGKVTSVRDGFCFMESRPGESNVYLPSQIADSALINVGDIITVQVRQSGHACIHVCMVFKVVHMRRLLFHGISSWQTNVCMHEELSLHNVMDVVKAQFDSRLSNFGCACLLLCVLDFYRCFH
jgi:hypothetical protein